MEAAALSSFIFSAFWMSIDAHASWSRPGCTLVPAQNVVGQGRCLASGPFVIDSAAIDPSLLI